MQAELYAEAVKKYLRLFQGCFGGVFYVFLRGLEEGSSSDGIYVIEGDRA
jgi:hypothetical protein